jgi:hypothetical protein
MLRFLQWSSIAVLGLTVSACATMTVSSHVERGLDFTQYHTWQWAPADALPASDTRLDNPFFQDHFQGAVERELEARGLVKTESDAGMPDLLVHYHANIAPRMSVNRGDQSYGACYDEDCAVRVLENEVGTIVLDVVDARTNRLIWRGWAQNSIEGVLDHPKRFQSRISEAVQRMFVRFPTRPATAAQ